MKEYKKLAYMLWGALALGLLFIALPIVVVYQIAKIIL